MSAEFARRNLLPGPLFGSLNELGDLRDGQKFLWEWVGLGRFGGHGGVSERALWLTDEPAPGAGPTPRPISSAATCRAKSLARAGNTLATTVMSADRVAGPQGTGEGAGRPAEGWWGRLMPSRSRRDPREAGSGNPGKIDPVAGGSAKLALRHAKADKPLWRELDGAYLG